MCANLSHSPLYVARRFRWLFRPRTWKKNVKAIFIMLISGVPWRNLHQGERPLNILTLIERPPDGMSTWTFRPWVSLTLIHNVHQHYVHPPPFRVDNMSLLASCPPSAAWLETCPSVTRPAQKCAILSLQWRRGVGSCQFLKHFLEWHPVSEFVCVSPPTHGLVCRVP